MPRWRGWRGAGRAKRIEDTARRAFVFRAALQPIRGPAAADLSAAVGTSVVVDSVPLAGRVNTERGARIENYIRSVPYGFAGRTRVRYLGVAARPCDVSGDRVLALANQPPRPALDRSAGRSLSADQVKGWELRPWGVIKLRGDPFTVQCDYDRPAPPRLLTVFRTLGQVLPRPMLRRLEYIRYDRTRRGWHMVVRLGLPLTDGELVALQFALGSDARRERYNLRRVICGAPAREWNLLFDRKLR